MHTYAANGIGVWKSTEKDPQAFTDVWQILADNSEMRRLRKHISNFEIIYRAPRGSHCEHDVEMEMSAASWEDALVRLNEGEHTGDLHSPLSPAESFLAGALWQKHRDDAQDVF